MSTHPQRLEEDEIATLLQTIPHWQREAQEIHRTFKFPGFTESIDFVNHVALLAEDANHHPNITICWNRVILTLSTHSQGGLTQLDFELAAKIDATEIG